jgi:hypothetical protein
MRCNGMTVKPIRSSDLPLWRIEPVAAPDDPRWLDHPVWAELVVRAATAAEARRAAASAEELSAEADGRSGLDDEKLYWVRRLDDAEAAAFAGFPGPVVLSCRQRPAA